MQFFFNKYYFNTILIKIFFIQIQLAITFVIVLLILSIEELNDFMHRNWWIFLLGFGGLIITEITLICNEGIRRQYPANMIILAILTICEGIFTSYIAARYKEDVVRIFF